MMGSLVRALRIAWRDVTPPSHAALFILLLGSVVCASTLETAATQRYGAVSQERQADSRSGSMTVHDTCAAVPGSALMGHQVTTFTSAELAAAMPALQRAIESASKAAHGIRPWGDGAKGIAGATFGLVSYRLGADGCEEELKKMAVAVLASKSDVVPAFTDVRPLRHANAAAISTAFDAWVRNTPEDDRAIVNLARTIQDAMTHHPSLVLMIVRGNGLVLCPVDFDE